MPSCSVPTRPSSAASRPRVPSWVALPSSAGALKMSALPSISTTGPGRSTTSSALVLTEYPASARVPMLSPAPNAHAPGAGDHLSGSVTWKTSGTFLYQWYHSPSRAVGIMFMANRACMPSTAAPVAAIGIGRSTPRWTKTNVYPSPRPIVTAASMPTSSASSARLSSPVNSFAPVAGSSVSATAPSNANTSGTPKEMPTPSRPIRGGSSGSAGFQITRSPLADTPAGSSSVKRKPPSKPTQRRPSASVPNPIRLISSTNPNRSRASGSCRSIQPPGTVTVPSAAMRRPVTVIVGQVRAGEPTTRSMSPDRTMASPSSSRTIPTAVSRIVPRPGSVRVTTAGRGPPVRRPSRPPGCCSACR